MRRKSVRLSVMNISAADILCTQKIFILNSGFGGNIIIGTFHAFRTVKSFYDCRLYGCYLAP